MRRSPNRRAATFGVWLLAAVVLVAWFVDSAATGTIKFRIVGDGPVLRRRRRLPNTTP